MAEPLLEALKSKFGSAVEPGADFRGEETVIVRKAQLLELCTFLRNDPAFRFDSMRDLCGADHYRPDDRFEVVYNLFSIPNKRRLRLKVRIDEADMHVASVSGIWSTADWLERETYDMYGIIFDGHPDLRRIYMPEEFEYHPLRKDFPLMGIPGSLPLPHKQS